MYPKKVSLFIPWTKAMVAGATVGSPDYGKTTSSRKSTPHGKRRRRRRKKRNASKKD